MRPGLAGVSDAYACLVGKALLEHIPGRVSTECDARLAYDTQATVEHADSILSLYDHLNVSRDRLLIKVAATLEGVEAIRILQSRGISCNATLVFSIVQAHACADAGVTLISPFVGRITDYYRQHPPPTPTHGDPGPKEAKRVFDYIKAAGTYKTEVMGASFRNVGQIRELAGIDEVTVSPELVDALRSSHEAALQRRLSLASAKAARPEMLEWPMPFDRDGWERQLPPGSMAREKLEEGVRQFATDAAALEAWLNDLAAE